MQVMELNKYQEVFDMKAVSFKNLILPSISLFTSVGTLLCCAMPALFVSLGAGAVLVGLLSNFPILILFSKFKEILFTISGILILVSGMLIWNSRNAPCPADPIKAKACSRLRKISLYIYFFSLGIYLIGFFFAFLAKNFL